MSFPREKYATSSPVGAGQPKTQTQSRALSTAAATDAKLAEEPWATAAPASVLLNIRLNAKRANRLMELGIGAVDRDAGRQRELDDARIKEAVSMHGSAAARVLTRYGRTDAAGGKQVDTGIKDELHALAGGQPVCLDRIWYDLEHRLGMKVNNIHLIQKEGDAGFSLRIFFSPADKSSTAPSGMFFWEYFRQSRLVTAHPQSQKLNPANTIDAGMLQVMKGKVEKDVAVLQAELDDIQKRLYRQGFRYRNPNGTWTVNTGQVWDGDAQRYHRVRLFAGGEFTLEATEMPLYRRRSVELPPPAR